MIYLNNNKLNTIFKKGKKVSFIICDFDRTITTQSSGTTWGIFTNNKLITPKLHEESSKLYKHYWPIEKDTSVDFDLKCRLMREWAITEAGLFGKYGINQRLFYEIIDKDETIVLRKDFIDFITLVNKLNIRFYIVSGGIFDVIKYVLEKHNILFDNMSIISNHLDFTNDYVSGIKGEVIHSCNKNIISLPIASDEHGLLFGDLPGDRLIGEKYDTIDIGFSNNMSIEEYSKLFDIVLSGNSSFTNVGKLLLKK